MKVIAICGKICSGKSYYANILKEKENAVTLSCDELTNIIFNNDLGNKHDEISSRIKQYLMQKAIDIVKTNTNVILDWGFWSKNERTFINQFFNTKNIKCEWHYIDISDETWGKNISQRNKSILDGTNKNDYYLDEGLKNKLSSLWQTPSKEEIDVWYKLTR